MADDERAGSVALPPFGEAPAFLPNVIQFVALLRRAGLPVATGQALAFAEALAVVGVRDRETVRHAARGFLVSRREDLSVFDVLFARFWRAGAGTVPVRARRTERRARSSRAVQGSFTIANYDAFRARALAGEEELEDRRGTWSHLEVLKGRRFAEMSPEELDELRRMMHEVPWRASLRRTRRLVPSPRGRVPDLRRALRRALRHGGLVLAPPRRAPRVKERPLVILADISGSMERYSRIILQFLHTALRARRDVECFVFGTRLTRITAQLRSRNVDRAIDAAAAQVTDWGGGTRIGDSLHEFNRRWSRRVLRRGAIAVVISDGLDLGEPDALRREMRWLRDRSWRLIWLNPLTGSAGFYPGAQGMAAAIQYVDDFLPAHNLRSLEGLVHRLHSLPRRRAARHAAL